MVKVPIKLNNMLDATGAYHPQGSCSTTLYANTAVVVQPSLDVYMCASGSWKTLNTTGEVVLGTPSIAHPPAPVAPLLVEQRSFWMGFLSAIVFVVACYVILDMAREKAHLLRKRR